MPTIPDTAPNAGVTATVDGAGLRLADMAAPQHPRRCPATPAAKADRRQPLRGLA